MARATAALAAVWPGLRIRSKTSPRLFLMRVCHGNASACLCDRTPGDQKVLGRIKACDASKPRAVEIEHGPITARDCNQLRAADGAGDLYDMVELAGPEPGRFFRIAW